MPGPLSEDLRKRVIVAVKEEGMSRRAAARRFGVSAKTAVIWLQRFEKSGETGPRPMGHQMKPRLEQHAELLLGLLESNPDWTLQMLADELRRQGIKTSSTSVSEFFARRKITRKKRR